MTKDGIYNIIRADNVPFWTLYINRGIEGYAIAGTYALENVHESANEDEKNEKSIQALESRLTIFDPSYEFLIELRKSKTANGTAKLGPFKFRISETQNNQQAGGLGSINPMNYESLGLVPKENMEFYIRKAIFDKDKEDFIRERDAEIEELNGLREKYQSNVETVKDGFGAFLGELIKDFIQVKKQTPLSGTEQQKPSSSEQIVESIANDIFNKVPAEKLPQFKTGINVLIEKFLNGNNNTQISETSAKE